MTKKKGKTDISSAPDAAGYTVLARRYRSRDFEEVVGQEPIARTLQNAISTNRTAHAYLFCGTRGVGKTSMARIFARALNVSDNLQQADEVGDAIFRGDDLDVIEIDGASNRGIQEAKDLIAGAGLSPTRCPHKIYIIDEVHMLTKEAFNALLKTMEEPPAHVKFILCTTDPHKVPPTIQSRCQRFDFRSISTALIADHLRFILKEEGIDADESVVAQIARLGNGSMRDALSLLDRLLAAESTRLTEELLEQLLGLPDQTLLGQLADAITQGNPQQALEAGTQLLAQGASVEQALELLVEHFRALMIMVTCGKDTDLLDVSTETRTILEEHARHYDVPGLVHRIAQLETTARNVRGSALSRTLFDTVLVRLCLAENFADIAKLMSQSDSAPSPSSASSRKKKVVGDTIPVNSPSRPASTSPAQSITEPKRQTPTKSALSSQSDSEADHKDFWAAVLKQGEKSAADQAKLEHLECVSFDGRVLQLSVRENGASVAGFLRTQTDALTQLVHRATGQRVKIELDTSHIEVKTPIEAHQSAEYDQVQKMPLVQKAMDLFDASIVNIEDITEHDESTHDQPEKKPETRQTDV